MPLGDLLKQPKRTGGKRSKRAQTAESILGAVNPAFGVAQGANELLSGGGAVGLGMAAAGMIPGVPGNADEIIEQGVRLAKDIKGYAKLNKISDREGLMDYLDILAEEGEKMPEQLLQAVEKALDIKG